MYEGLWHLVIPPVMTLLDDYEAAYKLRGIRIVSEMLERVPRELLKRTGVDELLFSVCSINSSLLITTKIKLSIISFPSP